jgi:outer membrane autotransporter protein
MGHASIGFKPCNPLHSSSGWSQRRAAPYPIPIVFAAILALSSFADAPAQAQDLSIDGGTTGMVPPSINPAPLADTGNLSVGDGTAGTLDIGAGGTVSAGAVGVGTNGGEGTVSITSGGSLTSSGVLYIGTAPTATNQSGVGTLGTVTVSGTGSSLTASSISVGASDSPGGVLSILNGGTVTSSGPNPMQIGSAFRSGAGATQALGTGMVTVDGGPSLLPTTLDVTGPSLIVGQYGHGTLTVQNGGIVSAPIIFVSQAGNATTGAFASGTINIGSGPGTSPGVLMTPTVALGSGLGVAGASSPSGAGVLNFDHNSTDYVFSPTITGIAGFQNTGVVNVMAGTTIFTADNTYGGATNISPSATLQLGNGGTTGSVITNVNNNGTLAFNRSDTFTFSEVISGTGGVTQKGPGTLILTGNSTYTGPTLISGGALQLGDDGTTGSVSFNIVNDSTLTFDHDNVLTFPHNVSGTGNLEQIGTGTTILSGTNTYTGTTTITNGILQAGATNTLPMTTAVTVTTPGMLNLAGFDQSIGSLAGDGPVTLGSATLTTGNDNTDTTFSGVMSGTGGLTKVGTGTFTLSGANDYTGTTTVSDGTLAAGGADVFSAGSHTVVESSGTLNLQSFNQTLNNGLVNGGTVQLPASPGVSAPGTTLTVAGNYVGNNGNLVLNTFLGSDNSPSDKLIINGGSASGITGVHINNTTGPGALTVGNGIPIVLAMNGATTDPPFALDEPVVAGKFDYRLFQGGLAGSDPQDWFLRSGFTPGPPPTPTLPILDPRQADYGVVQPIARELGMTMLGTLHERIGDTLTVENVGTGPVTPGQSAWGRFFGEQIDNSYQAFAGPNANGQIFGFQAGLDLWRGSFAPEQRDAAGLYFAYGTANLSVNGLVTNAAATAYVRSPVGTLGLNGYSLGSYWTHYGPGGWYLDGVVQGTIYGGNAEAQFTAPTFTSKLPTGGFGVITSLEAGYPVALPALGPRFILEPQAQIFWQHVGFDQAFDELETVGLGNTAGFTGRLGIRGQWTIAEPNGQVWQPYARANFWRAWGGDAATSFSGQLVPLSEQATWGEVAGGVTFKHTQRLSYYAQFGYQFAITSRTGISGFLGDIGLRYTW